LVFAALLLTGVRCVPDLVGYYQFSQADAVVSSFGDGDIANIAAYLTSYPGQSNVQ